MITQRHARPHGGMLPCYVVVLQCYNAILQCYCNVDCFLVLFLGLSGHQACRWLLVCWLVVAPPPLPPGSAALMQSSTGCKSRPPFSPTQSQHTQHSAKVAAVCSRPSHTRARAHKTHTRTHTQAPHVGLPVVCDEGRVEIQVYGHETELVEPAVTTNVACGCGCARACA